MGYVPYILMALPAGVWADWGGRKTLMVVADSGRLCLVGLLPLWHLMTGASPVWIIYGVQMGVSGLSALFDASYHAAIPAMVPESQWPHANRALQLVRSLSQIAGPLIGGVCIVVLGAAEHLVARHSLPCPLHRVRGDGHWPLFHHGDPCCCAVWGPNP